MTSGFYDMDGLKGELREATRKLMADEAETDALMRKLGTIRDLDQLETFAAGKFRVREMPKTVINAIAHKKIELQRRGLT